MLGLLTVLIVVALGLAAVKLKRVLTAPTSAHLTPAQLAQEYNQTQPATQTLATSSGQVATSAAQASPSASPQLSFEELNKLYGPCAKLPTLMYHHVQDLAQAKAAGHAQLTVGTPYFRKHLEYLAQKNYHVITMSDLIAFFDQNKKLPTKPVLLTFDDGYDDFGSDAAPLLKEFHDPATAFLPTGLLENPGYLKWSTIKELADTQPTLMSNHTWSHHVMVAKPEVIDKEITTAQQELTARGYDTPAVFAYPYGTTSPAAQKILAQKKYQLAFTTQHGDILCKGQRLTLPRIRVGNLPLDRYGF